MSIIHIFKDHTVGFKMTPEAWFYLAFVKVMSDYVFNFGNCYFEKTS